MIADASAPVRGPFDAIVLAGRRAITDPFAASRGMARKCLLPVAGVPMLVRVVEALAASPSVGRIIVSIDEPRALDRLDRLQNLRSAQRLCVVASAATPSLSALAAAADLPHSQPVLITTADNVLLSAPVVEWFCRQARLANADLIVALAAADVVLQRYPEAQRTFFRFRCGSYTGCNLFAVTASSGWSAVRFWHRVEEDRKKPWRLAGAFGIVPLLRYVAGRLSLDEALDLASVRMTAKVAALLLPFPEVAIDVDSESDLALAEKILEQGFINADPKAGRT